MARRSRRPVPVGDILATLLDGKPSPTGGGGIGADGRAGRVSRVLSAFARIGPPVTEQADAVDFRRGVLTLAVHNSAWLTELTFLRAEVIDRLNRMLGGEHVREVRLRLGSPKRNPPPAPRLRPLTAQEHEAVQAWAAPIADERVRRAVQRAAACCLARGAVASPNISGPPGPRRTPSEMAEEPPGLTYGYGHGVGERPHWTKDRWKAKRRGSTRHDK